MFEVVELIELQLGLYLCFQTKFEVSYARARETHIWYSTENYRNIVTH